MTASVKPNCIETNFPFNLDSELPVRIDHPSICTSDTILPSDKLFEPPPALEKEPMTYGIQVCDDNKGNGFVTGTSATKEPALANKILIDGDCLETNEDRDLTTVVLADKGKGIDLREYGTA